MLEDINNIYVLIGLLIVIILIIYFYYTHENNNDTNDNLNELKILNKNKNMTIIDILSHNSKKHKNNIALMIKKNNTWEEVTYDKYYKYIKNFAESMNYWLGSGTNIGIIGSNNPGWIYGHMGAMMNNGFSVPIPKNSESIEWEYVINKCKLEMLLIEDSKQLHKLAELKIPSVKLIVYYTPIEENLIDKFSIPVLGMTNFMTKKSKKFNPINMNDNAVILFGKEKEGICITHKNIINNVKNMIKFVNQYNNKKISIGERYLSYGSLDEFVFQIADIYLPILTVGTVWIGDNLSLKNNIVSELKDCRPSIFIGIPKIWDRIRRTVEDHLSKKMGGDIVKYFISHNIKKEIGLDLCKLFLTTGSYTSDSIKLFYNSIGIILCETYVLNEAGFVTLSVPNRYKDESVGKPLMRISIDKDKKISIYGDNLFSGYYKNKKLSKERINDGWFQTNQRGYIDNDGFLFLIDNEIEKIENNFIEKSKIFEYVIFHRKHKKNYLLLFPKTIKHDKLIEKFHDIDENLIKLSNCNKSSDLKKYIDNVVSIVNGELNKKDKINKYVIVTEKISREDVTSKLNINKHKFLELYREQMK